MSRPAITAYEYQSLSVGEDAGADLSPAEANALMELGRARPGFNTLGHRTIRLAQYVGLVNLGR